MLHICTVCQEPIQKNEKVILISPPTLVTNPNGRIIQFDNPTLDEEQEVIHLSCLNFFDASKLTDFGHYNGEVRLFQNKQDNKTKEFENTLKNLGEDFDKEKIYQFLKTRKDKSISDCVSDWFLETTNES